MNFKNKLSTLALVAIFAVFGFTSNVFASITLGLNSIAVTTPASKLEYVIGDTLDITNMVVTGTYLNLDGYYPDVVTITNDNISGFDTTTASSSETLTISFEGKTTTFVISVVDRTAPVITVTGSNPVNLTVGDSYTDAGATATDNVDAAVTVTTTGTVDTATVGTYTITYTASDVALNGATSTRTVNVVAAPARSSSASRSSIQSAPAPAPAPAGGSVLGAESINWNNLSAAEKAEMIKKFQAMLAEIIKVMNAMIADGTLK